MHAKKRQILLERVAMLEEKGGGLITAKALVADARKASSPLHEGFGFDWNDKSAAQKQRLDHARSLIRTIVTEVVHEHKIIAVPMYVHSPEEGNAQGYVRTASLLTSRDMARNALNSEMARAIAALKRARAVAITLELEDELEGVLAAAGVMLERIKGLKAVA